MISKIDINNFGLFSEFSWDSDLAFKKVNIIYGRNYSGKTTLSRIFRCVENGQIHEKYPNSDFSISLGTENLTQDNLDTVPNDVKVRVYNTDFVKANLSWLHRDDGKIESFALLGAVNLELEEKIEKIKDELGTEGDRNGLYSKLDEKTATHIQRQNVFTEKKGALDDLLRNKAGEINKNNIKLSDNSSYNIRSIEKDILQATESCILSDEEIDERKNLLKEEPKNNVPKIPESKPKFSTFQDATNELLSREIKPDQPITDLINDNLLQNWVLAGIEIHRDKMNSCGFCGNPLPHDLWDKLDAHFSEESKKLRIDIENLIKELETAKQNIQGNAIKIPAKENLYSCFHSGYDRLLNSWQEMKVTYSENLDCLIKQLRRREKDIFKVQVAIECKNLSDEILALCIAFNQEVIEKHNNKTVTLTIDQKKARDELRLSEVAKFLKAIDYQNRNNEIEALKKEVADLESDKNKIQQTINALKEEKRTLKDKKHDEKKGAKLVNEYLTRFFGHDGLMLVPQGTGQFKVIRNDIEATNLSEGECSLIAFCYFIAKINDELKDEQNDTKLIIYIDDPISSLDSNHIYFIFSLIDSVIAKPQKYTQLFISTHNLDFLKYLKRITVPNVPNTSKRKKQKDIAHFLVERDSKQSFERSRLKKMPNHIEKYATEFNYLFEQIYFSVNPLETAEFNEADSYDRFYNLSNNLRKFLECYLFFKYPNNENPLNNLNKFFDENDASFIKRVINEHSHLTHLDRGRTVMGNFNEIERCAKLVLDRIEEKDKEQFDALVDSLS